NRRLRYVRGGSIGTPSLLEIHGSPQLRWLGDAKKVRRRFMRFTRVLMPTLAATLITAGVLLASMATAGAQDKGKKKGGFQLPPMIHISIADFTDGARIPNKYT